MNRTSKLIALAGMSFAAAAVLFIRREPPPVANADEGPPEAASSPPTPAPRATELLAPSPTTARADVLGGAPAAQHHEHEHEQAQLPTQLGGKGPSNVDDEELDAYFNEAPANRAADRAMLHFLDAQPALQDVEYSRDVYCRGWLCRSEFKFGTPHDAQRLLELKRPSDIDFSYVAKAVDLKDTTVTVYSTLRGATFAQLLESDKGNDSPFSGQAALAHAAELEARWRNGQFE